jgi:hypothetical protein
MKATSCTASGAWSGSKSTAGSISTGPLSITSTYRLDCTGSSGTGSASVTITVVPPPAVTLSASPDTVLVGGVSTLTWDSLNATSCSASGAWSGSRALSGSESTSALDTASAYTYTLTCSGLGGTGVASATVTTVTPSPPPTITLAASPASISAGQSTTLNWSTTNADTCSATGGWSGPKETSASYGTGALDTTSTYELDCSGPGGTVTNSVTVTVWAAVINDDFDSGDVPVWYTLYNGVDHITNNCWAPSHVFVSTIDDNGISRGVLHLQLSYESTKPASATNCNYDAGWYTGGLSIAQAYRLHSDGSCWMTCDNQRITIRYRIVETNGAASHRIMPMASPFTYPPGPCGETDYLEGDGPLDRASFFVHFGPDAATCKTQNISNAYTSPDLGDWHTYRFEKYPNYVVKVYIDDMVNPFWICDANTTPKCDSNVLPDMTRKLVLQQECQHNDQFGNFAPHCPNDQTAVEDIQVDWLQVENPA